MRVPVGPARRRHRLAELVLGMRSPRAEPVPPANAYDVRTPSFGSGELTLAAMQNVITQAELSGGGWVPFLFHGVCATATCGEGWIKPTTFSALLDWLQLRAAHGTVVRTVSQVIENAPPDTSIGSKPPALTAERSASFTLSSNRSPVTFECSLDSGAWQPCQSPVSYTGLTVGGHSFRARARDQLGAVDPTPAAWTWTIESAPGAGAPTVVSLTFDDGQATQYQVKGPLAEHGMKGTFFVNSGDVCLSDCAGAWAMTWDQIAALAADGHEIGGHTLEHADLTDGTIQLAERRRQVCEDRANLTARGFDPVSFAYPYGHSNATAEGLVEECGYASGRGAGDAPPGGETIPPLNPFRTRTPGHSSGELTLSEFQQQITASENAGGGWVQLAFHGVCATQCDEGWVKPATFEALLDWLEPREADGTVVKTVREVMGLAAPETAIGSGPSGTVGSTSASFTFSSPQAGAHFDCRLDAGAWAACSSPKSYTGLAQGQHTFSVRAVDRRATPTPRPPPGPGPSNGRARHDGHERPSHTSPRARSTVRATLTPAPPRAHGASTRSRPTRRSPPGRAGTSPAAPPRSSSRRPTPAPGSSAGLTRARGDRAHRRSHIRAWPRCPHLLRARDRRRRQHRRHAGRTRLDCGHHPGGHLDRRRAHWERRLDGRHLHVLVGGRGGPLRMQHGRREVGALRVAPGVHRPRAGAAHLRREGLRPGGERGSDARDAKLDGGHGGARHADHGGAERDRLGRRGGVRIRQRRLGATFQCRLDGGEWLSCSSPRAYTGLGNASHTFSVRAVDAVGNIDATPATRTWTVDDVAPDTAISSGPSGTVAATDASFAFSSPEAGVSFQCRLDGGQWGSCVSPHAYTGLADGSHTFSVRALDGVTNMDPTPATKTWTIDTTPPQTAISAGPGDTELTGDARFSFSATEDGSFECRLDGGAWEPCPEPKVYSGLADGSHTFEVRAADELGNRDPSPAARTWIVQPPPPPPVQEQPRSDQQPAPGGEETPATGGEQTEPEGETAVPSDDRPPAESEDPTAPEADPAAAAYLRRVLTAAVRANKGRQLKRLVRSGRVRIKLPHSDVRGALSFELALLPDPAGPAKRLARARTRAPIGSRMLDELKLGKQRSPAARQAVGGRDRDHGDLHAGHGRRGARPRGLHNAPLAA